LTEVVGIELSEMESVLIVCPTQDELRAIPSSEPWLARLYGARCGSDYHPDYPWLDRIDKDIYERPDSAEVLLNVLRQRVSGTNNGSSVWQWVWDHPDYPGIDRIVQESINLFRSEGAGWSDREKFSFARVLEFAGKPWHSQVMEDVTQGIVYGEVPRERFQKRIERESVSITKTGAITAPFPETSPSVALTPVALPIARNSWTGLVLPVIGLGIGLALLLRQRLNRR